MSVTLPRLPYPEFPLRPHANGQWFKSAWSSITRQSHQFYFGSWKDDPTGERALHHPHTGWLARRTAIKNGTDNLRVTTVATVVTLGELMGRYLTFKRELVLAGDLSARTLGDYIREMEKFVAFLKPTTPVAGLRPEHLAAYMKHMIEDRKLVDMRAGVFAFTSAQCSGSGQKTIGTRCRALVRVGFHRRPIPHRYGNPKCEVARKITPIES